MVTWCHGWPGEVFVAMNVISLPSLVLLNLGPVTKGFMERKHIPDRTESLGSDSSVPGRAKHLLITWFRSTRLSVCFCYCQSALPRVLVCFKCGPLGRKDASDKCQRRKAWQRGDGL